MAAEPMRRMSRTSPSDVAEPRRLRATALGVVAEAGGDQRQWPGRPRRWHAIGRAVARRAPAARGGEQLVRWRARTPRRRACRRRRRRRSTSTTRQAVQEVGGAVDRVDEPARRRSCRRRSVPSSPTIASSGRAARSPSTISASAARSCSVTSRWPSTWSPRRRPARRRLGVGRRPGEVRRPRRPAGRRGRAARRASSTCGRSRRMHWPCPAISRHSPTARSTSTATMLIPPAATTAPKKMPSPSGSAQSPSHCSSTRL